MKDTNAQCQKSADSFQLPYGSDYFEINVTADKIASDRPFKALSDEAVLEKLKGDAVMSYNLAEVIEDAEKILIILPDATRKSGAEQVLPEILKYIEKLGKSVSFIIAVGTHRQPTEDEFSAIMTPVIYNKYKDSIIAHNSEDYAEMDFYGITKRKTTVLINKAYRERDTIITIGSVSYHYFAGYGGGRKLIFPGIAGEKAITANHKLALDAMTKDRHDKAVTGNLRNNPVHDDMVETIMIARSGHTFFAVNTLLDDSGKIADMVCGDIFMSHIKAAEILDEHCIVNTEKRYDLLYVSAGGFPKDINMIQAQKYLDRVVPLMNEGGTIVFLAECRDGYGNMTFEEFFDLGNSADMLKSLMYDYKINRQTAFNLKKILERFNVLLVSKFSEMQSSRMGFKKFSDIEQLSSLADGVENVGVVSYPADIFVK